MLSFPLQPLAYLVFVLEETVTVVPIDFLHTGQEFRALSYIPLDLFLFQHEDVHAVQVLFV